jgi:tRNA G10  N-methylase Trm11
MKKIKEILYVFLFCIPIGIIIYIASYIGILIFKLYKMGRTKDLLETEVKEFEVIENYHLSSYEPRNKYLFFYWKEHNDCKDWFEKEIKANTIDEALIEFRKTTRLAKLESIKLIN